MLIAAAGAIALGQWSEAAAVVFLFAVAQALEARTLERARNADPRADGPDAGRRAGARRARRAPRRRRADPARRASSSSGPARRFRSTARSSPAQSAVNQAPVTGESLPVDKAPGDEVFAGTINGRGALEVRVTRSAATRRWRGSSTWSSGRRRSARPSQTFVERFARVYTPAVIALAVGGRDRAAARRAARRWHDVDLPRAGAAGRLVPVRAGDLDAGVDRRGAGRRGAQGRADQGRRAPRARRAACAASRSTRPAR